MWAEHCGHLHEHISIHGQVLVLGQAVRHEYRNGHLDLISLMWLESGKRTIRGHRGPNIRARKGIIIATAH